jgi:hypothetical protein
MARTIIFYGTLYIAAFMLALDTGIKRSEGLRQKFAFVNSVVRGFLPLILLLIYGGLAIYGYVYLTVSTLASIAQAPSRGTILMANIGFGSPMQINGA